MESYHNRGKLMWASFFILIAAGIGFAIRGGILTDWGSQFGFTQSELGTITGGGLVGFGIAVIVLVLSETVLVLVLERSESFDYEYE